MTQRELHDLFDAAAPTRLQRERMLRAILRQKGDKTAMKSDQTAARRPMGALPRMAAALLALCLVSVMCFQLFGSSPLSLQVCAYESGEQLQGGQVSGGRLNEDGSGDGAIFYLQGEGVVSIRATTQNQYLTFIDWTREREQVWRQRDFTVDYGPDPEDYDKLVFYWDCFDASQLLRDPGVGLADLPAELRSDTITLTATFENGKTLTRVLEVEVLDDGEITLTMVQ